MDTKVFCNKVADALNISLKWYTKEDKQRDWALYMAYLTNTPVKM